MSLLKSSVWGLTTILFVGCNVTVADKTASDGKDAESDETMAEMAEGGVKDQEFSMTLPPLRDPIVQPVAVVKIYKGDSQIVGDDCRNDLGAGAVVQSKVKDYVAGALLGPIQLQNGVYTVVFHVTSNGALKLSARSVVVVESGKEKLLRLYLKRAAWCGPGRVVIQPWKMDQ